MKRLSRYLSGSLCLALFVFLSGCVINPLGAGSTVNLYTWDDRENAFASFVAEENTDFDGLFDGSVNLGTLLVDFPNLNTTEGTPYLVESCDGGICYYAVIFPEDLVQAAFGLQGFVVLNGISTALYNEVANTEAAQVRAQLNSFVDEIIDTDITGDGNIDYSDLVRMDFRFPNRIAALVDEDLPTTLNALVANGDEPLISNYVDSGSVMDSASPLEGWVMNENNTRSQFIMVENSSQGVLVDVESVTETTVNGESYALVEASGIPNYAVTITSDLLAWLNGRPKASSDFVTGSATVSVNQVVQFGEDIGYNSNSNSCGVNAGFGYWPPGPVCPEDVAHQIYFPLAPEPTTTECETGAGSVGFYLNGTSVFNWTDAMSYNNEGAWQNLAPEAEIYDVDICGGHAANGEYHHHFYSQCLADLLGDTGNGHSPLYGFASDGYPIYGPWHDTNLLTVSSWKARDYDDPNSATGCGQAGVRSCVLVDQFDVSQGTEPASANGPDTDGTATSASGNVFSTPSGFYFEDWYWDSTMSGEEVLDQYNAHSHDGLSYHYHVTVVEDGDDLSPAFPYAVGTRFAGELQDNASSNCSGQGGGMGGGGMGGGMGGMGGMGGPPGM